MQGTAIHLVDRVIPNVPVRQWVLSLLRWACCLLARDPVLITRTLDLFLREIFKSHRRAVRFEPLPAPSDDEVKGILEKIVERVGKLLRPRLDAARDDARTSDALASAEADCLRCPTGASRSA